MPAKVFDAPARARTQKGLSVNTINPNHCRAQARGYLRSLGAALLEASADPDPRTLELGLLILRRSAGAEAARYLAGIRVRQARRRKRFERFDFIGSLTMTLQTDDESEVV